MLKSNIALKLTRNAGTTLLILSAKLQQSNDTTKYKRVFYRISLLKADD